MTTDTDIEDWPASFTCQDPLSAPRIGHADILAGVEGVVVEPPGLPRSFMRAGAAFHDDPDGNGLFTGLLDPAPSLAPPVFTLSLRDVLLAGHRSVLTRGGALLNDQAHLDARALAEFAAALGHSDERGPLRDAGDRGLALAPPERPAVLLAGSVLLLVSREPSNYGSFLYRDLAKLANLPGLPPGWRVLADADQPAMMDMLELAGIGRERVVRREMGRLYRIEHAIIPGQRAPLACIDAPLRALYRRLRAAGIARAAAEGGIPMSARPRDIYVSRLSMQPLRQGGRVMRNEAAIVDRLRAQGVAIIEPQRLSAAEQIATFAAADLVIGPSGAGMFNVVFCRPGTTVLDIESEPHWIAPHANLFASAGLRYGFLEGSAEDRVWSRHHKPFTVNEEALSGRVTSLAAARRARPPMPWTMPGPGPVDWLSLVGRLHALLAPRTYLEFGDGSGRALGLARGRAVALAERFALPPDFMGDKTFCALVQMSADRFFAGQEPERLLDSAPDLVVFEEAHRFELALRTLMHLEPRCDGRTLVLIHNVLPPDAHVGRRTEADQALRDASDHPDWWAGDVWKLVAILQQVRPDLRLVGFPAAPAGLLAISGLDPSSTVLQERYLDLVEHWREASLVDEGDAVLDRLDMADPGMLTSREAVAAVLERARTG